MANQAQLEAKIDALQTSVDSLTALILRSRLQVETRTEADSTTTTTAAPTTTTTAGA